MVRSRVFATASALAVIAALGAAGSGQASSGQASGAGVAFSSQPGMATLLGHWVVSPSARAGGGAAVVEEGQMPLHYPKGRPAVSSGSSSGVNSNNTASDSSVSASTPGASSSFIGQQASSVTCSYFVHGCNPPDMGLAASPGFALQGVNTQWAVYDTAGNVEPGWPVSAQSFLGAANVTCDPTHLNQPFLSDPRALYDPVDQRFWAAMLQVEGAIGIATSCPVFSAYYIAVSQTSDPRGKWNVYEFEMGMGQLPHGEPAVADFTQIGINSDAVYFSANMFSQDGNFYDYAELFEANKARMEKGLGNFTADGFFNLQATGPGTGSTGPFLADTVQPTVNLDGSAGAGEAFVDTFDGPDPVNGHFCGFFGGGFRDSCSGLAMWTMTNPTAHDKGGPAPTLAGTYVPTQPFVFPPPADEPGCSVCVDASDLRIGGTPVIRNGVLYAAWETGTNSGVGTTPGIIWAQVDLASVGTTLTGYYNFSAGEAASYPTLMPDSNGNVTMVFEHMGPKVDPETRYVTKSASGNFSGAGVLLKAGEDPYRPGLCGSSALPVCRWGDYEATSFDGTGHIWFAGEYANTFNPNAPQFGRNWGTWIGAISAS